MFPKWQQFFGAREIPQNENPYQSPRAESEERDALNYAYAETSLTHRMKKSIRDETRALLRIMLRRNGHDSLVARYEFRRIIFVEETLRFAAESALPVKIITGSNDVFPMTRDAICSALELHRNRLIQVIVAGDREKSRLLQALGEHPTGAVRIYEPIGGEIIHQHIVTAGPRTFISTAMLPGVREPKKEESGEWNCPMALRMGFPKDVAILQENFDAYAALLDERYYQA